MLKEVKADKAMLVDGPASVRLLSGEAEVLAAPINVGERVVIRGGKRVSFYVEKGASFELSLGRGSNVEEVYGETVPLSWQRASESLLSLEKPAVAMILGPVDSGKTSLCTFLVNKALRAGRIVAVIDSDLGQSDVGAPTTIGLAYVRKHLTDLFHVEADDVCFVGFTSPAGAEERVVKCIVDFRNRVLAKGTEFLVINTDGWVEGEEAARYKTALIQTVGPAAVVGIAENEGLAPILEKAKSLVLAVEPSTATLKRDRERRKALRELGYKKYLRASRMEAFPLSWTKIEGVHSSPSLFLSDRRLRQIEEALGTRLVFCEETVDALLIVLRRSQSLSLEGLEEAERKFKKKVRVMHEGDEEGLIVGLHDGEGRFLGLGVICDFDYGRKTARISTPVREEAATIRIGRVRLDQSYREVGTVATLWS